MGETDHTSMCVCSYLCLARNPVANPGMGDKMPCARKYTRNTEPNMPPIIVPTQQANRAHVCRHGTPTVMA